MFSNYESTDGQPAGRFVPSIWQSIVAGLARAMRQARGRSTAADVAAMLVDYGVCIARHHEANEHAAAAIHITKSLFVEVGPNVMFVTAYFRDMPRKFTERRHSDIVGLAQDIFEARDYLVTVKEELLRQARQPWKSTAAEDLAGELVKLGVADLRVMQAASEDETGFIAISISPWIGIEVEADDCFRVVTESPGGMRLSYPRREHAAEVVADLAFARTCVFPPCHGS